MIHFLSLLLVSLLIQGCSTLSSQTSVASKPSLGNKEAEANPATVSKPFEPETLYSLLVAEIAGSRQQYDITLGNYVQQAHKTSDIGVIIRATRIAQLLGAHKPTLDLGLLWLQYEPDNAEANTIVAIKLSIMGQLMNALSYAEKVNKEGDNPLFETIALHSGKVDQSTRGILVSTYNSLSASRPQVVSIKVGLSILYMLQHEYDRALTMVEEVLNVNPDHISAVIQQVKLLHLQKKTELAVSTVRTALGKHPDNNRLRLVYARLLTKTDLKTAYKEFEYLSQASPEQLDFKFSQALIALELKEYEIAEQLLASLYVSNYRPDDTTYYLGRIAEKRQQFEQALIHYLQVNKGSHFLSAHIRAAKIMINRRELQSARHHFTELRKNHDRQASKLYVAEVELLMGADKYRLALDLLDEAIMRFPDSVPLRYHRSLVYEKIDKVQLMEEDLCHLLALDANNVLALNALGYFLTAHTDRHEEALILIEKALSLSPDDPAIIDSMGWVLFNLGRYQQSLDYLRKAFNKFPDGEIAAHLGEVLWVVGEIQEAKDVWSQGLERQPNDERILKTLERLNVNLKE